MTQQTKSQELAKSLCYMAKYPHVRLGSDSKDQKEAAAHILAQEAEIEAVRHANLDCVDHFEALKIDYDKASNALRVLIGLITEYGEHNILEDAHPVGKAIKQAKEALK